jgi:hypothetical protein
LDGGNILEYPSYTKPAEEVLKSTWIDMIAVQGHTALLLLARGSSHPRHASSWMIDPQRRPPLPPWILESLRRARETLDYEIVVSDDVLAVSGCYLDQVWEETRVESPEAEEPYALQGKCRQMSMQDWAILFEKGLPQSLGSEEPADESPRIPSDSDRIESQLRAFEQGVRNAAKHSVRLVRLRHRGYRMLHQDAQHMDQVWKLENCPLPVVLRPVNSGRCRFIGEVCPVNAKDVEWCKTIWEDFDTDDPSRPFQTVHIE